MTSLSMNNLSMNKIQRGNFTVEFAIIGVVLSLLLTFSADVIVKLSGKGKLDRLSYAMVNLLKERTQLYEENYVPDQDSVDLIVTIATGSLQRTMGRFNPLNFGYLIESVTFDAQQNATYTTFPSGTASLSGIQCVLREPLSQMTYLSKMTTWGRRSALYRVTLCYNTDNWIGQLLHVDFIRIQSDAVSIGR
ncbi:hypothetical protein VA7868_03105 [Vibrio aerogenes CECT 7868]|uniref:Uncharacterized protein n=1 Tax=Vibrio aerogenes CECT 7868 TaxID=1216006 RepID=A0A1M5ZRU1_9VIBR|nr:tight adherence pilus pseudopilin TadF [Vibrio aerogenes]SHI26806.1 hypothetical protein VA7868_03105 [Vibrio aerogenes CECT 7868]